VKIPFVSKKGHKTNRYFKHCTLSAVILTLKDFEHSNRWRIMKKIEAIIRPLRLEAVKTALAEAGVTGMTASDVRGCGRQRGHHPGTFRGEEYVIHLPAKIRLELTVRDDMVDEVIDVIMEQARTGEEGDGKIFVLPAAEAIRIRTGETGEMVL
jgi:nitrogen regulatory protein P-II 1